MTGSRFEGSQTGVEWRILGPLEVRVGGQPLALGGSRLRNLVAALLLAEGEVVSAGRLVDILWGESPPRTALLAALSFWPGPMPAGRLPVQSNACAQRPDTPDSAAQRELGPKSEAPERCDDA